MLDITFYSNSKKIENVEVSESFYEWLAKSPAFTAIASSITKSLLIDDEEVELELVYLVGINRRKYSDFFRGEIVEECSKILESLEECNKDKFQEMSAKLKTLEKLRKLVEDESFLYMGYL
ncbi:MAG: hypothetical protein AAF518_04715 [Spirochaetota bacterium]